MHKSVISITFFLLILSGTATTENCSIYNPCGKYGYCYDNKEGNWQCECKFWWHGSVCDYQSTSGIQVIVLSVLVAILIILFYGLSIYWSIRKKKQQPKPDVKNNNENNGSDPKLTHVALVDIKQSARFSSCLIAISMIIITVIALVVKRSLLQPIHNELVNKYKQGQSLFYERNSFCDLIDAQDFNLLTFPVACFLILIFIIFSKRSSCLKTKLNGYIGPVIPLDFDIHIKRKFAAVIFAIIADEVLDIINEAINGNTSNDDGVVVVYLLRIATVLVIGFRYYPELSAVYMDTILTLTCATIYAWLDFSITIVQQGLCHSDFYPSNENFAETNGTDLARLFGYYGTGQNLIIIQLCTDIPRYICWSYIVIKLPILLIEKIHRKVKHHHANHKELTREEKVFLLSSSINSTEMCYVRNLFLPIEQRSKVHRSLFARLIPKFIYQWRDDFRFSSRIFCIYSSVFLLLYFITTQACILVIPYLNEIQQSLQEHVDRLLSFNKKQNQSTEFPLPNFLRPYVLAILTAFIITMIQLFVLLVNIRRNLFQIYRGNDSEIPKRNKSDYVNYSTGNFHFAGYFIGYLIWGYVLIVLFALVLYTCIDALITFGSVKFLEYLLKAYIPTILLIFLKLYLNKLLARFVFLQDYGDLLAINNRRILMIFLYFNFFLDAYLGFVSSIMRIVKSMIGGCLYMCRLDYSPLGRKLETLDAGFAAYCGFIHLEAVHRNPIMLVVTSYLYGRIKAKQSTTTTSTNETKKPKTYSSKSIRKWYLAIFLIRNPSMVFLRKSLLQEMKNHKNNKIEAINAMKKKISSLKQTNNQENYISEINLK